MIRLKVSAPTKKELRNTVMLYKGKGTISQLRKKRRKNRLFYEVVIWLKSL